MQLTFWQNILSPHQSAFIRSLADLGHEVTVVAADAMTGERLAIGWGVPELGRARIIVAPAEKEVCRIVREAPPGTIHVMAGARLRPLGKLALRECLGVKSRIGVLSEAPDPRGVGGWGRWAKYTIERYMRGTHYDFVLAMGEMGVRWFKRCGYPDRKLFPFAYVTEPAPHAGGNSPEGKLVLLFVGRFVELKGLDVLLRAFAAASSRQVELRLLGEGPEKQRLEDLARNLGIVGQIAWLAKRDNAGVLREMAKADVTLLPSHKDGWGAVVNESLMAGTPVICSTACGAAELIRQSWLGTVFRAGSVEDLTGALRHWIGQGTRLPEERERIRNWSACISGEAVAKYFVDIMDHVYGNAARAVAPWRRNEEAKFVSSETIHDGPR